VSHCLARLAVWQRDHFRPSICLCFCGRACNQSSCEQQANTEVKGTPPSTTPQGAVCFGAAHESFMSWPLTYIAEEADWMKLDRNWHGRQWPGALGSTDVRGRGGFAISHQHTRRCRQSARRSRTARTAPSQSLLFRKPYCNTRERYRRAISVRLFFVRVLACGVNHSASSNVVGQTTDVTLHR
jgi:hypothetical protein